MSQDQKTAFNPLSSLAAFYTQNKGTLHTLGLIALGLAVTKLTYDANYSALTALDGFKINPAKEAFQATLVNFAALPVGMAVTAWLFNAFSKNVNNDHAARTLKSAIIGGLVSVFAAQIVTEPMMLDHNAKIAARVDQRGFQARP